MKNKKVVISVLIAVIIIMIACIGIGMSQEDPVHEHSFGEWETKSPATCDSAELLVRHCSCGEEETREGSAAAGHNMQVMYDEKVHWTGCVNEGCDETTEKTPHIVEAISAVCNMENPMAGQVVQSSDVTVTGVCGCGASFVVADGVEMEGTTLVSGKNTVIVKYGDLSADLIIEATKLNLVLDGIVSDDTYVSSSNKDNEYSGRNELGTNVTSFRTYFRINIKDILAHELFAENNASVRFSLTVTSGSITEDTTFTLKAYTPAVGVTDTDFSALTWNSVDNKEGSMGAYNQLHWKNGTEIVSGGVGDSISVDNGRITITLAYRQIADFVDENGNVLFAFATNTSGLKVASMENETEANDPAFQVILSDEHFHVFDQAVVAEAYFASANCGECAQYYMSCACGEAGSETFGYGEEIPHTYVSISAWSTLATPMENMALSASDFYVTANCECGASVPVPYGVRIQGDTTLAYGQNVITVKYSGFTTSVTIYVTEKGTALGGEVIDDTYVSADKKGEGYIAREELGTNTSSFRAYFRVNISDALENELFAANDTKVQFVLTVTSGSITEDTAYTLKSYTPVAGVTDIAFSDITWNSVDKDAGAYKQLHWNNGTVLVSGGASDYVSIDGDSIIITLAYRQITDFVDENGNIIFAFGTNTKGLKVGSLENDSKSYRPAFKVILTDEHFHVFDQEVADEKYLASDAKCGERAKYYLSCSCGEAGTDTFEYGDLKPHTYVSILAESKLENPTVGMTVTAGDLTVTGTCACGAQVEITEGIELENATLTAEENTVTVKYGSLSTTVVIKVGERLNITLDGTVKDDTYVDSSNKDKDYSTGKKELGTNSSSFRTYFRVNISDALENELFTAGNAKVQLILTITSGEAADTSTYTLKTYVPAAGVTDIAFSDLTWNSVDKDAGAYKQLHWNNGTVLVSGGAGDQVSVDDGVITITLAYSQIADFVDENGNILLAFGTNTKGLKVGSLENDTESSRPAAKIVLNVEHTHVFDREVAEEKYLATNECGKQPTYYKSCECGEKGTDTFGYGAVNAHVHQKVVTEPTCTEGGYTTYTCDCGDSYVGDETAALGHDMKSHYDESGHWTACSRCDEATEKKPHTYVSILAESKLENPTVGMTVTAGDLTVTGTCACGAQVEITEGIELENATLAEAENTVTVKYGSLSTTVVIKVGEKLNITLDGTVKDDTYVAADKKDEDYSTGKKELGTNSSSFRTYFRVNISDALENELFTAGNAKVQLILTITSGEAADTSTYTLKTYVPAAGVTDIAFSDLTWNSVDKDAGAYKQLHWNNGTVLVSGGAGDQVSVDDGVITITLAYSQIADFVDENGNILLAFGTNTKGLKVGSMENDTEASRPVCKVILSDEHFHVFDQEATDEKYLASHATCTEKATYYKSCTCGEKGTDTFSYGELAAHAYGAWETKSAATCTEAEVEVRKCACGAEATREGDPATGHSFVNEVAEEKYLATNECGKQPTYYKSCECGEKGTDTFGYGAVNAHVHQKVVTEPTCTEGGYTTYTCSCGDTYVSDPTEKLGHDMKPQYDESGHWTACSRCDEATEKAAHTDTLLVESKLENPMVGMTVQAEDLTVTVSCECGKRAEITEGITLENAALVLGENTVTVKYGGLSAAVTIHAAELDLVLDGTISDDTYVDASSGNKDKDYSTGKKELGTNSSSFRTYFRVNISEALENELFTAGNAKVQLILTITSGEVADTTTYTMKTYAPVAGVTDIAFSDITWNSVDKDAGAYKQLHWNNGSVLVSGGMGHNVSVDNGVITITLAYSQIADFVDEKGNILFAFGTNTKNLKVGSLENDTESSRPAFKVLLNEEHFHVFDQEVVMDKYLISTKCEEKAKYYVSCSCGEAGTETFQFGDVIAHSYTKEVVSEDTCKAPATCGSGALYFYSCEKCGHVNNAEGAATFVHGDPAGEHSPAADDNNCETAVVCTVCGGTTTEARTHDFTGEWLKDANGHWHKCGNAGCTVTEAPVAHSSAAPATATEDEVCQTCGYIMTPASGHIHHYDQKAVSEKFKVSGATCTAPATYYYSCSCGESSKSTAEEATFEDGAALDHSYTTLRYDETHHWYECANDCGTTTGREEHSGGTATDIQKAICEGCHQPYGELKTRVTVSGTIVADTFVASDNKDADHSTNKKELNARKKGQSMYRSYVRFDFSDVLNAEGFDADSAKVEITLTISTGSITDASAFTIKAYTPVAGVTDVGFEKITWNSVDQKNGTYKELHWDNGENLDNCEISVVERKIIVTVPYNNIASYIDSEDNVVFAFYSTIEDLKIASMENEEYAPPAVSVTYLK